MNFRPAFLLPVLLAALLGACASAPPPAATDAASPAAAAGAVQRFTLDNGLTVIVKPDRRAPTAVHMLWLRVGAMDEVDGTSGVAHVLEHMMFKGSERLAPGEFSRRVAQLGGRENAFTSLDYTGYYQQVPAARLGEVMALEAERFAHLRYSDEVFAKELEVVKEERRLRTEDNPRALLFEQQRAATFVASPYRRPVVGWMGDLQAMTADDARAFYRRWYVPGNAAVVVVGDVEPQAVLALARRHYGGIAARPLPERKPRPEPAQPGLRRIEVKAPAEQAVVSLAFRVPRLDGLEPGADNDDALALTVLAAVLEPWRARFDTDRDPTAPLGLAAIGETVRSAWSPGIGGITAMAMCYVGLQFVHTTFVVVFLVETQGRSLAAAGGLFSLGTLVAIPGRILWGWLGGRHVAPRRLLAGIGFGTAAAFVALAALPAAASDPLVLAAVVLNSATVMAFHGLMLAEVARLAPPGRAGQVTGGVLFFAQIGQIVLPPLFGLVAVAAGYAWAWMVFALPALVMGAWLWRVPQP